MASEKTQDARLAISGDNLTVSCTNPDAGEIKDDIQLGIMARYSNRI